MAVSLEGLGTPEERWRASGVLDALPTCRPADRCPSGRIVVVAPHPDDEVLGLGGCLAAWAALGRPVTVVAVTAGEGSHPGSPTLTPARLAARRREERSRALATLGVRDVSTVELGLPDGAVDPDRVETGLADLVHDGDTVVAPVEGDGHPDHDATAVAARRVSSACGVPLLRYAVWLWHWAAPEEPRIDWTTASRVTLPPWSRDAKHAAARCFRTQLEPLSNDPRDAPILPAPVLARLLRDVEIVWGRP